MLYMLCYIGAKYHIVVTTKLNLFLRKSIKLLPPELLLAQICTKSFGFAYSAPPDPLAGLRRPTSKGRRGEEREGMGGRGRREKEGERGRGRGKGGRGWPDQSQTRCYGSVMPVPLLQVKRRRVTHAHAHTLTVDIQQSSHQPI